jgi:predicted MFS family arabinose efflux permease/pimeloyl-ACP methyl ester carboxylesterase
MTTAVEQTSDVGASKFASPAVVLLIFGALVDSQVVAAITPQISEGLNTTKTAVAESVTFYSLAAAVVALGLGRFSHRVKPSTWLPMAAALFAVACVTASLAPNLILFDAARSFAGLAAGLISALSIAAIANASHYAKRGRKMGGIAVAYFLAPVVGVPLGAFLAGQFGWRSVFLLSAALVSIAGFLVFRFPLPAFASGSESDAAPASRGSWLAFSRIAFRNRSTFAGVVGAFFVSGGLVGFTTYLATWLADAFQTTSSGVAGVYALAGAGAVAGGAFGGALADRFGKRTVAVQASLVMAVLLLVLPTFNWGATLLTLVVLTALAAALRVAPLQALITELVAPSERAAYVALRNASSQVGIAAAVVNCGWVYERAGLAGVGAVCAVLTVGAWAFTRVLQDPHVSGAGTTRRSLGARALRWVRAALVMLVVIVLVVLPWFVSFIVTKARTRPQEQNLPETPSTYGVAYEDVTFTSADGVRLSGWYVQPTGRATTVVMTHGLFRSRFELLERGVELARRGYGVLLYDLRRHGKSSGEFCSLGYTERKDVEAAFEFAKGRSNGGSLALMGVSMGAAATLMAAAELPDVQAIVVESSFLSFSDTIYHHLELARIPKYPFAPELVGLTSWRLGFAPSSYDVRAAVARIERPILFIGGGNDVRMPTETVLEPLYAAASNPAKQKLVVEGASHGHAFDVDRERYMTTVLSFLESAGL